MSPNLPYEYVTRDEPSEENGKQFEVEEKVHTVSAATSR